MDVEENRSFEHNDDTSWLDSKRFDYEKKGQNNEKPEGTKNDIYPDGGEDLPIADQVKFMRDQIKCLSEEVAELKSSDKKGTDRLGPACNRSLRSSEERVPSASESTVKGRKSSFDPDESTSKQISELVAELQSSNKEDTAQESSSAFRIAKGNKHFSDGLAPPPSQLSQRGQDIDILCCSESMSVEEKIKVLVYQNRVMDIQIEDIKKKFKSLSTRVAELASSRFKDADQVAIEENTKYNSLASRAVDEPTHTDTEEPFPGHSSLPRFENTLGKTTHRTAQSTKLSDRVWKSILRPNRRSVFVGDFGDKIELEADIYSVFFISRNWGSSFFFSLIVAFCQFLIASLMLIDLLQRSNTVEREAYGIPPKIEIPVVITQFFSLVIAFVTVDDMMVSLKVLVVGYDPDIKIKNPAASYSKFLIANLVRFFEGFCTISICLVIIIQSSEVLQLFMDFIAASFISHLDNISFQLAEHGFLGARLKSKCERVRAIKIKVKRKDRLWLIGAFFVVIFCPFLAGLVTIRIMQVNGTLLGQYACENLDIRFGDETLIFNDNVRFSFVGEGVDKTFANSIRTLPHLDEIPSRLLYQFFAGSYVAEKNDFDGLEEHNSRPVYWENGLNDPTSGKFYYCGYKNSWVFTIEALYETPGAMAEQARNECEWGWLMLSPPTDATTLNDAPIEGWNIWTGNIELSTSEFSISCADCARSEDCGLSHGYCDHESRTCVCNDGWQGSRCQVENPFCPGIVWVHEGESSRDYFEFRPVANLYTRGGFIPRYDDRTIGFVALYYGRPIYLLRNYQQRNVDFWIIYVGRRWVVTMFETRIFSRPPHAYWDNLFTYYARWYSDPTTSFLPTGRLTWNEIEVPRSTGNFGLFGASFPVQGRYECIQVDCMNNNNVCGDYGTCVAQTEVADGTEASYNQCKCENYTGGYFCEHHPDQPYSRDMYNEYIANPALYREDHPDLQYLKFWINETAEARGGVVDQDDDQNDDQYDD